MKKKLIFALIFLIIAIGAVSAGDASLNDNHDLATNDINSLINDGTLSMDDDSDDYDDLDDDLDDYDDLDDDLDDYDDLDDDLDDYDDLDDDLDDYDDYDDLDDDWEDDWEDDWDDDLDDDYEDINAKLEIVEKNTKDKTITFKLTDSNNNPIPNINLGVTTSYDWEITKITTNTNGLAVYKLPFKTGSEDIEAGFYEVDEDGEIWYSSSNDEYTIDDFESTINLGKADASLSVSKAGNTYKNTVLTFKLTSNRKAVSNENINIKFSNGQKAKIHTNSKGKATYTIPFKPGTYSLTAELVSEGYKAKKVTLKNIKITKTPATLTPTKLKAGYASGKAFTVKLTNAKSKKAISGTKLTLQVYTGKKAKTFTVKTNAKGIASYDTSKLGIGSHKVVVKVKDTKFLTAKAKTSSITITKATLKLSAPKVTNAVKSGTFKVTVKNKDTNKAMKDVKVSVKIFTGKKAKTYTAKTKANGEASFSTKALSKGTHKVIVNVKKTSNFKAASTKSSVVITKSKIATTLKDEGGRTTTSSFTSFATTNFVTVLNNGYQTGYNAKMTLRDANGKELHKTISVYYGDTRVATGTSGKFFFVPKMGLGTFTFKFAGDNLYKASSCKKYINLVLA